MGQQAQLTKLYPAYHTYVCLGKLIGSKSSTTDRAHISAREGSAFCRVVYKVTHSSNLPVTYAMDFELPRPYFSKVEVGRCYK